jgi:hypothetical protein
MPTTSIVLPVQPAMLQFLVVIAAKIHPPASLACKCTISIPPVKNASPALRIARNATTAVFARVVRSVTIRTSSCNARFAVQCASNAMIVPIARIARRDIT